MGAWQYVNTRFDTIAREFRLFDKTARFLETDAPPDNAVGGIVEDVAAAAHHRRRNPADREFRRMRYVGRPSAPSPATGSPAVHAEEQRRIIEEALL